MTRKDVDAPTQADPAAWPIRPDAPTIEPAVAAVPVAETVDTVVAPPPPPVAEPVAAVPPPDRRIGAGMLLALAVLVLVAAGIVVAWLLTHRGSSSTKSQVRTVLVTTGGAQTQGKGKGTSAATLVAVPRLVGDKVSDAQKTLSQLGFKSSVQHRSSSQPAGTVIGQAPAATAKLQHGSVIALTVAVPAQSKATQTTPGTTTTTAATTTTGTTTPTTTAATSTPTQTQTTAAPPTPQTATVPDVTGNDEATAMQSLVSAGVIPSIVFVPAQDPLGTVVQTAKPAGTKLTYHAHMQVNLSTGPGQKEMEQVPNVVGKTLDQAVSALQAAKLRLIFVKLPVTTRASAGKIVQQTPAGGQAPQNAQILVFLGAFRG